MSELKKLSRLEIFAKPEQAELVTAYLALYVAHGWEEEINENAELTHFLVHSPIEQFCLELDERLHSVLPDLDTCLSIIEELDWVSSWKDFFTPVEAGENFVVLPPWLVHDYPAGKRKIIIIEPKSAFGTGHHATTALCLTAISNLYDACKIKAGDRFLDLGTGSGILGVGAAKLGLSGIGVDVDILAVENSLENRTVNKIKEEDFAIRRGSLEAVSDGPYELVIANILAEPLINLAAPLVAQVKQGGSLVLSGVLAVQAKTVEAAYTACGLPPATIIQQDEWVALLWKDKK